MAGIVDFSDIEQAAPSARRAAPAAPAHGVVDFSDISDAPAAAPASAPAPTPTMADRYSGASHVADRFFQGNLGADTLKDIAKQFAAGTLGAEQFKTILSKLPVPDKEMLLRLLPKPPMAIGDFNPMDTLPAQALETAGTDVKSATQKVIGDTVASAPPKFIPPDLIDKYQTGKAVVGSLASAAVDGAPLTPSDAALAVGGEFLGGAVVPKMVSEKLPNVIGNKILDTTNPLLEKEIRTGAEKAGTKLLESELDSGTRESLLNQSNVKVSQLEKQISGLVNSAQGTINKNDVVHGVEELVKELAVPGIYPGDVRRAQKVITNFLESQPDQMPIQLANSIKRQIYDMLGDKGYLTNTPSTIISAQKYLANGIKRAIEKVVPEISALNSAQGKYLNFREMLIHATAKDGKSITKALLGDAMENVYLRGARELHNLPNTRLAGAAVKPVMSLVDTLKQKLSKGGQ